MSIWVNVFCTKPLGELSGDILIPRIREYAVNYSELYSQEDPAESLASLRFEIYERTENSSLFHLHYLHDDLPVVIDHTCDSEVEKEVAEEHLEVDFDDNDLEVPAWIRTKVEAIVESVSFCLKQRHADGMGAPIVYAAAAWLAEAGDGLVRIDEQGWGCLSGPGIFEVYDPLSE
jgi:hypothetical protein